MTTSGGENVMDVREWCLQQTTKLPHRAWTDAEIADAFAPTITKLVEALKWAHWHDGYVQDCKYCGEREHNKECPYAEARAALAELEKP